ncbi:Rossmann-like and DUF2520 domain-containing protein [Acidaminobacter sp.]|uniref:Rossmann-like and DUF2520 domain-containing protein n=1 Tax=Acidaminobacter sp. TaxID=1872102 RepID=UPI00137CD24F|nr:Rossmann-like and DUF2520 domain-containing protein [Acidaminobacter sp.]MDK9710823.1 DUF2520 domain-containing protein [Acidaminobacter sp.]MZQ98285.1 DUF2520 domain-containing protein [Acidaminobacter sp.]
MRIGIIGAGKVGTSFGLFLKDRGETITGYVSRTYDSACEAAALTGSKAFQDPLELIRNSELIFLTVVDDQIEPLAAVLASKLAENIPRPDPGDQRHPIFVHMSGAHSILALEPLAAAGFETASLHPLQSVSEIEQARNAFGDTLFTVEMMLGGGFEGWLATIGISFVRIEAENKALYHVGAVFASNFVVTVLDAAIQLFEQVGFSEEEARRGLMPLVYGSVDNVARSGAEKALTGPVARGDVATVAKHLEALEALEALEDLDSGALPEAAALYKSLSGATLSLAMRYKLTKDPGAAAELKALLAKEDAKHER